MKIYVNGDEYECAENCTIIALLEQLSLPNEKVMACAVDGVIVKKDEWISRKLSCGQKVELLNFVGGG